MEHRKKRQRNWYGLHVLGLAAVCLMLTACGPDKGEEEDTTARTESTAQTDDSSYSRESGTEPATEPPEELMTEDETFAALSLPERTAVQDRILTEIRGRMMEDIVLKELHLKKEQNYLNIIHKNLLLLIMI